jgi:CheY-like chemotaxis protein
VASPLVLIVEDDIDGQELVSRILRHHRTEHIRCSSAEDALNVLSENTAITAAIIDLALPGIDGWSLLEVINNDPRTVQLPCVAITAFHSPELAIKAVKAGFAAYFPKPLDATSFMRELQNVLHL